MTLTVPESLFLTALAREQNQTGCQGPAHDLLRKHVYPDAPLAGPGSLAFSYEAVPLTGLLLEDMPDLQAIDDFLRKCARIANPAWPWSSAQEFKVRLEEARKAWTVRKGSHSPAISRSDDGDAVQHIPRTGTTG
jgi:hypothetical protein